jgi:nitronate monooxygenase
MPALSTRLTEVLGLRYPVLGAPMAFAGGGALAAAVSQAGGLGLIGGGYGDSTWLDSEFDKAGEARIGVGFITWSLKKSPPLLTDVLRRRPAAVMLSFGDPRPFVDEIRSAGAALICQCQTIDHVWDAIDVGADVIVAQNAEAGGHGARRGGFSFTAEVADLLAARKSPAVLVAAGGIADGRGLAAALMLGAEGVLIGTRLWAAEEALVHARHHAAAVAATGDDTIRTTVVDIARQLTWPPGFTARVRHNAFVQRWHGREEALKAAVADEAPRYRQAFAAGDPDNTGVWFGEAAGLIAAIEPAAAILETMVVEARRLIIQKAAGLAPE